MSNERGQYRCIYSVLLDSKEFQALTLEAMSVFFFLRTIRECHISGIFIFFIDMLADRMPISRKRIVAALNELEQAKWIVREENILWIRNALRYQPNFSLKSLDNQKSLLKHINSFPRLNIVQDFREYYNLPILSTPSPTDSPTPSRTQVEGEVEGEVEVKREGEEDDNTQPSSVETEQAREIIAYLNEKTKKKYQLDISFQ